MKLLRILTIVVLSGLIASCAQGASFVSPATPTLETLQVLPTASETLQTLQVPTPTEPATATVTATYTETPTLTLVPSLTFSPTPAALFDQAKVTSLSSAGSVVSLVVSVPGLKGAYNVTIEGRKYTCVFDPKYADRLFCTGQGQPHVDQNVSLVFSDPASGQVVYDGTILISHASVPTETPVGYGSCPGRGKNIFCEVECRIYNNSDPCIVATCNDDCGVYYSIATCPDGKNTGICDPDLEARMLKLYGIPARK